MIRIENISKTFKNITVINNLSLTVNDGEVMALVGKNGAGKTTLMRLIGGILAPDNGKICFDKENAKIGILLGGDANLYPYLTAREIIVFFAKLNGMLPENIERKLEEVIPMLSMEEFIDRRIDCFSRGMRQKTAFAISIFHNPDILLLDEPSTGLDILASKEVIDFINLCKIKNKTILMSTHNISEISMVADRIAIMNNGKIEKIMENNYNSCSGDNSLESLENEIGAMLNDK
ncbi:MAG: ATP-binding cassette domain-containing protein [Oscillospiraceae bacterium]|nr:ATP-binding cassette domain-containing protein [Oscillospiraceae bacterium]